MGLSLLTPKTDLKQDLWQLPITPIGRVCLEQPARKRDLSLGDRVKILTDDPAFMKVKLKNMNNSIVTLMLRIIESHFLT